MLNKFEDWFQSVSNRIENIGYEIEITKSLFLENPIIRINFDSDFQMAVIIFWKSGACEQEILDVESEKIVFFKYIEINSNELFDDYFDEFIKTLSQTKTQNY